MADKKKPRVHSYALAFVLGLVAMVVVDWLFQATGSRNRAGTTDTSSGNNDAVAIALAAGVVQTAAEDDASPSAFLGVEV